MQFCTRKAAAAKSDLGKQKMTCFQDSSSPLGKELESPSTILEPKKVEKKWWPHHYKIGWKTLWNGNEDGESSAASTVVCLVPAVAKQQNPWGQQDPSNSTATTKFVPFCQQQLYYCVYWEEAVLATTCRCLLLFQNWYSKQFEAS